MPTNTIRESVIDAVTTAVGTITTVGGRIYRSRVSAFTRAESPAILITPISDTPDEPVIPKIGWTLLLRISVLARGDEPDAIADPICKLIHDKIIQNATLQSLCVGMEPDAVTFNILDADKPAIVVNNDFRFRYQTSFTDISV